MLGATMDSTGLFTGSGTGYTGRWWLPNVLSSLFTFRLFCPFSNHAVEQGVRVIAQDEVDL